MKTFKLFFLTLFLPACLPQPPQPTDTLCNSCSGVNFTQIGTVENSGKSIIQLSDGGFVVAGISSSAGASFDIVLLCYDNNGELDTNFGTNGIVTTAIHSTSEQGDVIQQNDGKLVVTGSAHNGSNTDFAIARYNLDGTIDNSFGSNGTVITPIGTGYDFSRAIIQQADGKLVLAGYTEGSSQMTSALVRYNSDGSLDNSFGNQGISILPEQPESNDSFAIIQQTDNKLVIAGFTGSNFSLARLNADGSLDTAFGNSGVVTTIFEGRRSFVHSVIQQDDGKLIAGGTTSYSVDYDYYYDFAITRYNEDGSLDTSFGNNGKVITDVGQQDYSSALIQLNSGKLLAIGDSDFDGDTFMLARYDADGALDTSFVGDSGMGNGVIFLNVGPTFDAALDAIEQTDGKFVVSGRAYPTLNSPPAITLARFNPDGTLDTDTFGPSQ